MLSTGTAASIGIDTQILLINLHIQVFLNIWHHIQGYEGCLTFTLGIEGTDTYQSVYPLLRLQITIGIDTVYLKGNRLDSRFISIQEIQYFHGKPLALRPSVVHTVKHTAPVTALGTAGSRIQLQNRIVFVIFPGKQGSNAKLLQLGDKLIQFPANLRNHGLIVLLVTHLY